MIRQATTDDFESLTGVLSRAFADDPLAKWLVRSDDPEGAHRRMFAASLRFGLQSGEVVTNERSEAAAIWFAPGRYRMGPIGLLGLIPEVMRAFGPWQMLPKVLAVNEVGKRHPKAPHWYLFSFAVDPPAQGKGLGGAILRHGLQRIDAEGAATYLETAQERNVSLYERYGFSLVEKVQVPRGGPPVWLMWRDPR